MDTDDKSQFEIVLEMPDFVKGPVCLPTGDMVTEGDIVEHSTLGRGKIIRFSTYHDDLGILLFVEFPDKRYAKLCLDVVNKVKS